MISPSPAWTTRPSRQLVVVNTYDGQLAKLLFSRSKATPSSLISPWRPMARSYGFSLIASAARISSSPKEPTYDIPAGQADIRNGNNVNVQMNGGSVPDLRRRGQSRSAGHLRRPHSRRQQQRPLRLDPFTRNRPAFNLPPARWPHGRGPAFPPSTPTKPSSIFQTGESDCRSSEPGSMSARESAGPSPMISTRDYCGTAPSSPKPPRAQPSSSRNHTSARITSSSSNAAHPKPAAAANVSSLARLHFYGIKEGGLVNHFHFLRNQAGISEVQGVEGGFYYLSGDKKLHFLKGARPE